MPENETLTDALRTVLEAHDIQGPDAETLLANLMGAVVDCFAHTSTKAAGVPVPIDLAMALAERSILRFQVLPREEG